MTKKDMHLRLLISNLKKTQRQLSDGDFSDADSALLGELQSCLLETAHRTRRTESAATSPHASSVEATLEVPNDDPPVSLTLEQIRRIVEEQWNRIGPGATRNAEWQEPRMGSR